MRWPFSRKPDISAAASTLGKAGAATRRARERAKIRANAGKPPVEWPAL